MTEDEVEAVAQELAKVGGSSWYPGRAKGPLLRIVSERYKDRARVAIAALDRFRSAKEAASASEKTAPPEGPADDSPSHPPFQIGATVVYRPPGDQRAISCRIEQLDASRAYLVPLPQPTIGWVSLESLQPLSAGGTSPGPKTQA